jgi:hypothetical protein
VIIEFLYNNNELKISLLSLRNSDGKTPLEIATINEKKNIINIIKALDGSHDNSAACNTN